MMSVVPECSVCLTAFVDPRVLSCGHTICFSCVRNIAGESTTLLCPLCRLPHANFTRADRVPRNVHLKQMIEDLQKQMQRTNLVVVAPSTGASTNEADEGVLLCQCQNCPQKFPINGLIFCKAHSQYICPKCSQLKHRSCKIVDPIDHACEIIQAEIQQLEDDTSGNDKSRQKQLDEFVKRLNDFQKEINLMIVAHADLEIKGADIKQQLDSHMLDIDKTITYYNSLLSNKNKAAVLLATGQVPVHSTSLPLDNISTALNAIEDELKQTIIHYQNNTQLIIQRHRGITCNGCKNPIIGNRYKCVRCPDYDLCEACENKAVHHEHSVIRSASPADRSWNGLFRIAQRALGEPSDTNTPVKNSRVRRFKKENGYAFCDSCRKRVTGPFRYRCIICPSYDHCKECESKHFHDVHPMVRITPSEVDHLLADVFAGLKKELYYEIAHLND